MKDFTMIRKWIGCGVALLASLAMAQGAMALSSATSGQMVIDTRVNKEKVVVTFGRYWPSQSVCYSGSAWDTRFANETAEVTADGVTLVKSASEGQVSWRPARVGLHTLHHTVHGGTLTRTYYAEGPTVRIVCTQTGTAGSMLCQIDCDMPGATIYYTTDGTEPTTASRVYTGPFQATLPKVKRLLAVAVVDGYPMSQTAYPIISIIEDVSVMSSATSGKMVVDTRAGKGPIATDHAEDITYSNLWAGDASATATVAVNGDMVKTATVEGVYRWPLPSKGGNYALTHQTMKNGTQVGETLTATFVVASHEIEIDDGTGGAGGKESRFSSSGVYDGKGHGISVEVTSVANPRIAYSLAKTGPYVGNLLLTNACDATAIWYTVAASGYNTYTNWATVTITPRPVTVKSGNISKVYDGTPLKLTANGITADNLVAGESFVYRDLAERTAVGETEATFTVSAGTGTRLENYDLTTEYGTLTVTKASIGGGEGGGEPGEGDVPDGGLSKFDVTAMYDGEGHTIDTNALVAAFGTAMIGEFAVAYAADDGNGGPGVPALPWLADAPVYTNAGEYVVWYRVKNPNYEGFVHAAKVTITKRPVTVAVAGHTATYAYDTTEKSVSGYDAATEDALYDIAADTVFSGTAAASRTDAGTTAMGLTPGDFANSNANFYVTYEVTDGWLRVTPRVIGDDPSNWDIRLARNPMYDGTEQSAPITQVAFVKPDGNLDYIPYELSGNTATDSGNYIVRITGTGNYSGTVEKEWAITPRNVTLSSGGAEWVYDGEAHSQSAVSVTGDGFVAGEGASYSAFPVVRHVADAATPRPNTFEYTLNANTKAQNYVITTANGTVKMSPRAITLTAPTKEKDYDGAPLTFGADEIVTSLTSGGQGLPALPNGEAFTIGDFASITEAGRVDATFTVADGTALMADYAITTVPGTLTVRKNATEITVTAKSGSWVYDGTAHTLHEYEATNLGVLQPGDALEVTFSDESVVTTPIDGEAQNGVVDNVITSVRVIRNGKDDVTANYTLAPYNGTLTVTKRPVTLTSKSDSKVYDGEELTAHEIEVGGDGFVGADGATYVFIGSQTEKGKSKNTFTYSLKGGTNAAFYDITKVEGDLEVTSLDIAGGSDEDWEIVLGPALTYTGLEQVQTLSSVTYKGLSLDYTVSGNIQKDAGAYRMTLAGQGNFAGTHEVEWTIAPKALTLTAGSGSRVYDGAPFMVGSVTAVGFVSGEGAEYECDGEQKDVGTSPNAVSAIRWSANTLGSNYTVTKVAGTLTVTPRPVTLTAANISKPYDGTPLALTAADIAADGIVAGESFVYSNFASRTEAGQTPATFDYAPGAGTSLANYTVTVTPGRTVTITKSATAISVTAASESWVYDGEAHSNRTWTATNLDTLQTGDALEVTFDEASVVTTPQDGANGDGTVPNVITGVRVIRSGAEDVTANYTVEWFPGTLAVTKRPVTVTVVGESATYTYDSEEKTVAGYDISTEDELYDIAADTVFGGTQSVSRTDAGKTEMGLSAADFTNDNDCFDVAYAVTDGWVKIVPADIATGAEGDFAIVLGENPKYNGTVQTIPVGSVTYKGMDVTYTLAGENATHAGTYTLTVKANGNFTGERSTTWQVLKRNVTFTSASATKAYDASPLVNPNVTVGGDGFIGIEGAIFDVSGSQTVAGSSKNTFSYTLKAGTLAGDYDITKIEGELTVTKATYPGQEPGGAGIKWNVAADAATWMYDGKMHEVSLTGVPAGVTAHISGNAAKDAGEYTASVTFDYDEANFEAPVVPAPLKWTITRRPLSLKTVNAEKPYDGFPLSVEAANITPGMSGYADGECFDYFNLASITEVGETPATFSYRDSATAKVANYAVQVIGGAVLKVTVGGDQISVTAKDGVWCYDGEEHALREWNIVNGDKLIAGHEFQIKIADESVITTPKDGELGDGIVSNRFEYVRIVDTATGADRTRNYNLFLYEGKLQVTNACVGVEMLDGIENVEKVYDGAATNVVVAADLLQPATVRYCGGRGVSVLPENPQWTDEPLEFTDAGEYAVWYEVTADYYNTYTGKVEVTIGKRSVALTSPTKAKPYDGAALTFDANEIAIGGDGLVDGESFAFSGFASITDAGRVDAAFDYAAGANTSLENYAVTVVAGTLTVNASADEITVTAKSGVWKYDSLEHTLHDCEVVNGDVLQSGDELVVEYDAASRVTTPDDGEVENRIVSVKVMRGGAEGEDVTRNYSIAVYPGTLRVVNADVSFGSVDTSAFSTKAVYDGEGHTIAVTAPSLLTSPVTVTYAETAAGPWRADPMAVAVKNAGTHTIRYRVSAKYYNDYIGEATVVITPRKVTLLSASAKKVFDGTPLRVDEVGVKEGSLDFADGEGVDAVCNSSQTGVGKIENGFSYEFRAGTLKDNYTIVPEFGWLEVTPGTLAVDVVASSYVGVYDGKAHGVTPKFTGMGLNLDACEITYARVAGDESAYAAEMPTFTDVGTYTVYVKIKAQNFEVVYTEMTVTIAPRPVTVTVTGKTATFTYDKTEKFVEGYHIASGDALYDVSAGTVFSGTAKAVRTVVGTTAMNLASAQFSNVNGNFTVTYAVTDGWVKIEKSTFDPQDVFGGNGSEESPLVCEKVYDGSAQSVEIKPNFNEEYRFLWSLTKGDESSYSEIAPTLRNVADGDLTVYFKFVTENYEPYCGKVVFRILPKELTDEMVQLTDEAFFFDPESGQKTPSVTVADTNSFGTVISTAADYDVAYGDSTSSAGAVPVTVTAKNNYIGTVTKTFPVLKRPVAPPVIGTKAYNGRTQKATVTTDSRWTVVRNNGGVDVGEYEVVLRLTNTEDYRWKGIGEDEAEWTGVFRITKANNGWSRYPGMTGWTYGETPSEPVMGQARYGTVQVAYRRKGADVSTETATKPSTPGTYIARFWVDETENHIGVALSTPYEVEFEIAPGAGGFTETQTTPVPVPYVWLDPYLAKYGNGDYEAAGHATGANGVALWESYVAGLDPEDPTSRLRAFIEMAGTDNPVITWSPDLRNAEKPRTYTILGKATLLDADWTPVTDANKPQMRFFKVKVEME